MNKRTFPKLSSMLMAKPVLSPMLAWAGEKLKNWAGNVEYSTEQLYAADSMEEIKKFVTNKEVSKSLAHGTASTKSPTVQMAFFL